MESTISPTSIPLDRYITSQPKAEVCEIRVLRSNAEIEEVREVWTHWQNHPNVDMDSFLFTNQQVKHVLRPHVILVLCGGRPKAMVIGRISSDSVNFKIGYKSIADFPVLTMHIIRGGLLGEQTPEVVRAILDSLKESLRNREAEILRLSFLPAESEVIKRLPEKVSFFCRDHFTGKRIYRKMTLGCTAEEMYARLSHKHRQHLRRQAKVFEKDFPGGIAIRCFQNPEEVVQMATDVEEIAKKTYQRGLGGGYIDNERNRGHVSFEARQRWLRMFVLYVNAKPCAYWYGIIYHNTFYSFALGFDVLRRKYSPGTYLFTKGLEDLCKEGVKDIHFGLVDAQYKQQFGDQHGYETIINVCAARPRLIALMLMSSLSNGQRALGLAVSKRFKAAEKIKMFWRHKCASKKDNSQE